jgi:hypothetical protein
MKQPLFKDAFPALAGELAELLQSEGQTDLVGQVALLRICDRCRCGDDFCGTFYTVPKPKGAFGRGHETVPLSASLILDLVDRRIVCVEVLDRGEVRRRLLELFP